jgi:RNA polymerase sigma-70 factor, ECF subfamily
MVTQESTDQDLESLFKSWLQEHRGLIFKVAGAFARTEPDRQDLTQEILLQIWRSTPRFEPRAKVSTWIYRVALNTALAWRRKENRHAAQVPLLGIENVPADPPDGSLATDHEVVGVLYGAIRKLPKVDACLVMMYLDDLTYREMAEIAGISEDNVGVKLNRARRALTELMKGMTHES